MNLALAQRLGLAPTSSLSNSIALAGLAGLGSSSLVNNASLGLDDAGLQAALLNAGLLQQAAGNIGQQQYGSGASTPTETLNLIGRGSSEKQNQNNDTQHK